MDDLNVISLKSSPRKSYRFNLKSLLTLVVAISLVMSFLAREHRRAQERVQLVVELTSLNVLPELEEPTTLCLWMCKRFPVYESWIRDKIGPGWFSYPTVFVGRNLEDRIIPKVLSRLKKLGTVREVLLKGNKLTDRGEAELYAGLPTVNVAPLDDPTLHQYLDHQLRTEHFAAGALALDLAIFLGIPGVMLLSTWLVRKCPNVRMNSG